MMSGLRSKWSVLLLFVHAFFAIINRGLEKWSACLVFLIHFLNIKSVYVLQSLIRLFNVTTLQQLKVSWWVAVFLVFTNYIKVWELNLTMESDGNVFRRPGTTMFMLGKEVKWKNNSHLMKQVFFMVMTLQVFQSAAFWQLIYCIIALYTENK